MGNRTGAATSAASSAPNIIREQKLRYFAFKKWTDATLSLNDEGCLTVNLPGKADEILEIPAFVSVSPPTIGTFPGVFVIHTQHESESSTGPRFACKKQQDADRWIQLLSFVELKKRLHLRHQHPLSPSMKYTGCHVCKDNAKVEDTYKSWICEFCEDYAQCSQCHEKLEKSSNTLAQSPNHSHQLIRLDSAKGFWVEAGYTGTYECDKCGTTSDSVVYHCVECGNYDECPACALKGNNLEPSVSQKASDLAFDLGHLEHVVAVDGQKHSLKVGANRCPERMSLKTNEYWDLSTIEKQPVPHAYMEVTFDELAPEHVVGVGIGNQIFKQNNLLGHQQNSFCVFNDGKASVNSAAAARSFFNMTYGKGDTVGVGILLDSFGQRKAYFTKNGQYVGVIEDNVHKGMDCFPGVSFTKQSQVSFTVNFSGPFKLDANSIPNYRDKQQNVIYDLPADVLAIIASMSVISAVQVNEIRTVSKRFAEVYLGNSVWKEVYLKKFTTQNPDLKIKSWLKFYKRRKTEISPLDETIENCAFEFECPLKWSNLKLTEHSLMERYCDKCQKNVYHVNNVNTLREYTDMGRCTVLVNENLLARDLVNMDDFELGRRLRLRPQVYVHSSPWG